VTRNERFRTKRRRPPAVLSFRRSSRDGAVTDADVKTWLRSRDKEELVGLVVEQARTDVRLEQKLRLAAATSRAKAIDLAPYRAALLQAVVTDGYVDYRRAADYASGIEEAVEGIEELLDAGYAAEVVELAEEALGLVEKAVESCDDSDGSLGGILENLQDLHFEACRKARPDPEALADRLFQIEMGSGFDVFHGAAERYASVLGPAGLAAYRRLAEERWSDIRPLGPGEKGRSGAAGRFRITAVMAALARVSGDVEALVAVQKRDLSTPYDFLTIAETYGKTGKGDLAIEWAEKGVAAFPDRPDPRLTEFLADRYLGKGRGEEAMALLWAQFTRRPRLPEYQALRKGATRTRAWPAWRQKALELIREQTEEAGESADAPCFLQRQDRSRLVEILLWEKRIDAAWEEARSGGCSAALWLQLARERERMHPEDAVPIYVSEIERALRSANDRAYHTAVDLLKRIDGLMVRLGRKVEFDRMLVSLRTTHKAKRNLLKLLDRTSWS